MTCTHVTHGLCWRCDGKLPLCQSLWSIEWNLSILHGSSRTDRQLMTHHAVPHFGLVLDLICYWMDHLLIYSCSCSCYTFVCVLWLFSYSLFLILLFLVAFDAACGLLPMCLLVFYSFFVVVLFLFVILSPLIVFFVWCDYVVLFYELQLRFQAIRRSIVYKYILTNITRSQFLFSLILINDGNISAVLSYLLSWISTLIHDHQPDESRT